MVFTKLYTQKSDQNPIEKKESKKNLNVLISVLQNLLRNFSSETAIVSSSRVWI